MPKLLSLLFFSISMTFAHADPSPHPSPVAVAISPDRRTCLSANQGSDSVSLVNLAGGKVLHEQLCGLGPTDVLWIDDRTALVSLSGSDAVAILEIANDRIGVEAVIDVGDEPRGLAGPIGLDRAFVAVSGTDQVAVIDFRSRKVISRIPVGEDPRTLVLSPNGRWLITACSASEEIMVHDAVSYELLSRRSLLDDTGNLGVPTVLADSSACILPHIVNRSFPIDAKNIEKGWVIDNRLSKLPLPDGQNWDQVRIGLDTRGDAVGDAFAASVSPDGRWLVVTCGGTHELLIFELEGIPWPLADPGDFIPAELLQSDGRFRRLELGGRPLGVTFSGDHTVVIANFLLDALQIVDVEKAELLRTISLGGPKKPNLARQGEALFYDADRSRNSWFSCHTCHVDGHTSGLTFDTVSDGSYNSIKLTPSLRGVTRTGPWTWHGWQQDLGATLRKSLTSTMQPRQAPTDADAQALLAFLGTLEPPVSPHLDRDGSLTSLARRGEKLFRGKAGCSTCHQGEFFTSSETYDVGSGSERDVYPDFNPPSLRGVNSRRRFLHDGRVRSLEELLRRFHRSEELSGEPLDEDELRALIGYLESL